MYQCKLLFNGGEAVFTSCVLVYWHHIMFPQMWTIYIFIFLLVIPWWCCCQMVGWKGNISVKSQIGNIHYATTKYFFIYIYQFCMWTRYHGTKQVAVMGALGNLQVDKFLSVTLLFQKKKKKKKKGNFFFFLKISKAKNNFKLKI